MIIIISAAAATFGFGIFFNLRGKKLAAASVGGAVGWLVYMLIAPYGEFLQYFAAAIAITVYSEMMARIQKAPSAIYLAPALIPLVPGGTIYEAMLYAIKNMNTIFLSTGIRALIITGALTLGIVTTASAARLITMLRSHRIH